MRSSAVAVLCLFCALPPAQALQFYLRSGANENRRCFYDSAPRGSKVLGEYTVAAGHGEMPIDIDVRNAENTERYFFQQNIRHGKFAFVIPLNAKDVPVVEHAEMHEKKHPHGHSDGGHAHHRRRLLVDSPRGVHRDHDDDDDDDDWDMDEYEGIDEEKLEEATKRAADGLQAEHDAHYSRNSPHQGHGATDDSPMEEREIEETFAERKFTICLHARGGAGVQQRRVRLVLHKGESAKDMHRLAKKHHMTSLEASLRGISSELHDLLRELERAHQMEEGLRAINQKTNRAVVNYATISIVAMAIIGLAQAQYTKGYLKTKKIS